MSCLATIRSLFEPLDVSISPLAALDLVGRNDLWVRVKLADSFTLHVRERGGGGSDVASFALVARPRQSHESILLVPGERLIWLVP